MEHQGDQKNRPTVYSVTAKIIHELESSLELPSGKATLANLRNSIGRPVEDSVESFGVILEALPDEFLGRSRSFSKEELAIITAVQLYAMHQQSLSSSINLRWNDAKTLKYRNFGYSLSNVRNPEDSKALDRRFSALISSTSFEELTHHLRQLISLYKARLKERSYINYPLLAQDLYDFLLGYDQSMRLNWSRAYYRVRSKEESQEIKPN